MKYCDLQPAVDAYARGENVTELLRTLLDEPRNSPQIIEIAYDLQAGSYIEHVLKSRDTWRAYTGELAAILKPHIGAGCSLLEVGTGEMTTLAGVADALGHGVGRHYAMDISWSRIERGRTFLTSELHRTVQERVESFVADLFRLPFADKEIDVVWTSHAIEPNGGRETEALKELFRVARRKVVLFEPSYEKNSREGQQRMERLGYIKGLPDAVAALGGHLDALIEIRAIANPLNPTYAFVVSPPGIASQAKHEDVWACPATRLPMIRSADCFWSPKALLAYPIIGGIPVLRQEAAVLASAMS